MTEAAADTARDRPWESPEAFPLRPEGSDFGYRYGRTLQPCTRQDLIEVCTRDQIPPVHLVWTPDAPRLTPPAEVPFLFEALKKRARRRFRVLLVIGAFNSIMWLPLALLVQRFKPEVSVFFFLNLLFFGLLPSAESLYALWRLRSFTPESMAREAGAARYGAWLKTRRIVLTWGLLACLLLVGAFQGWVGPVRSIARAGLVKDAVREGQVWRLLTCAMLHGGLFHFVFNATALVSLGRITEVLAHRAHLALVFLLSILGGSISSLFLLPRTTSVGASGGLMGLIGFLAVLGFRRRSALSSAFLRSMLVGIALTAAVGFLAREVVDNAAHLGGLACGGASGFLLIRDETSALPLAPTGSVRFLGTVSLLAIAASAGLAVWKMLI